jgi:excisionase family DNA binding protein
MEEVLTEEALLTAQQVATLLNCDVRTVYRNKEEIGYITIFGKRIRFKKRDVEDYLQSSLTKSTLKT